MLGPALANSRNFSTPQGHSLHPGAYVANGNRATTSAQNSRKCKHLRDRGDENDQDDPFDEENRQGGRGCSNNGSFSSSDQQDANGEAQTGTPEELQAKRKRGHGETNRRAGAGDV